METKILYGKEVCLEVYGNLAQRISSLNQEQITPGLAVILIGNDPASQVYVNNKSKRFKSLGLHSEVFRFPENISQNIIIKKLQNLNSNPDFHSILIQLPLPKQLNADAIINIIDPKKDVDGFHPYNFGKLAAGEPTFIPCTPKGIMRLLKFYNIDPSGKHVVIVGRSNIVGRPLSILTSLKKSFSNATTTLCHSGTSNINQYTQQADIIILAMGKSKYLKRADIKQGAVVIDVGINRVEGDSKKGYSLSGDADMDNLLGKAGAVTPVPGGVGPMTIAMLVENTVEAAEYFRNQ